MEFLTTFFEQAIEAAIEMKLKTVEAGAQGEHKIQRGYLPTATYSAHYLPDPDFRDAIASFLRREGVQVRPSPKLVVCNEMRDM
jgi:predicted N-acyltransferase